MALHCKLGRAARPIGVTDRAVGAACRDLAPEVRRTERIRAQARSEYTSAIVMTMTVRGRAPSLNGLAERDEGGEARGAADADCGGGGGIGKIRLAQPWRIILRKLSMQVRQAGGAVMAVPSVERGDPDHDGFRSGWGWPRRVSHPPDLPWDIWGKGRQILIKFYALVWGKGGVSLRF